MGYSVRRHIGVGEREHVRANLVQVLCLSTANLEEQILDSLRFAIQRGYTLRIYMNGDLLTPNEIDNLSINLMGRFRDHDIMIQTDITPELFDWILNRCDFLILPSNNNTPIIEQMRLAWAEGRGKFNVYNKTLDEIKQQHASMYSDQDFLFKLFTNRK